MRLRPLRLLPGDDLRRVPATAATGPEVGCAFVVSGLGSLTAARRRYAGQATVTAPCGPLGILGVSGTPTADGVHLRVATLPDGRVVPGESTLLAAGPDGTPCRWPVMSEISVVLPHRAVAHKRGPGAALTTAFASGSREDTSAFREEITIRIDLEGGPMYAHAWGLPGGAFDDRSSCRTLAAGCP